MTSTLTRPLPRIGVQSDDAPPEHPIGATPATGRRGRPTGSSRNTTRIAIGLMVLVVSVLATLTLYSSAGDRHTVIAVRRDVAAGKTITIGDLKEVSISADASVSTMPAADAERVIGEVAAVPLAAGSLLTSNQVGAAPELAAGEAMVGAVLKAGQYPSGLQIGSTVGIVDVPTINATGVSEPVRLGTGRVSDITESSNDGTTVVVSLIVADTTAESVASAGAAGRLSLVVQGAP